ncbi:MAG: D-alanine--D-alanine ligase [Actinomycetales bacterium]|nr:D-alanine--D-alanine ligase [Actinomycetales bacterium]
MNTQHRPRVLVLFGGVSGEHSISCVTAGGVLRAIDRERYDVLAVGITRSGRWVEVSDDPDRWAIVDGVLPEVEDIPGRVILPQAGDRAVAHVIPESPGAEGASGAQGSGDLAVGQEGDADDGALAAPVLGGDLRELGPVDVVFPLLHGPYGEDGTLQGMLELAGVRFVGAGVLASAVSMDKQFMKLVLSGQGLPVGPYTVIPPGEWERDRATWEETVSTLGLPVFVKPARAGSSLGVTRVAALEDLGAAIAAAREHDPKVLVEAEIRGREIECAVLGGRDGELPRVSLPGEIKVHGGEDTFYDFGSKYLDEGEVDLICPAELPEVVIDRVQDVARRTFEAVSGEGLARVDVFVTEDGDVVVNEINTMPGFTPISMYPRMWAASGIDYPHLVHELIQLALARPTGLR